MFNQQFEKVDGMIEVYSMPEAFTPAECDLIIATTAKVPADEALLVGRQRDHNLRQAELVWLDDVDGMGWVMDRLIALVSKSNRDLFDFDLREFSESPQVARYQSSNGGHFAWHSDIGVGVAAAKRKLTLVLQLSKPDNYEGGNLEVMPSAHVVTANRAQGCVSVFPSFSLHHVTPVTSGERHSLTVWAHGPAFR
jgi:PKHD-type hydroxylase